MASCQWLLLNHILREKSSIARGLALLLNMVCKRVGIQVEILIRGGLEETQYYLAVVPAEARAEEPYEIACVQHVEAGRRTLSRRDPEWHGAACTSSESTI